MRGGTLASVPVLCGPARWVWFFVSCGAVVAGCAGAGGEAGQAAGGHADAFSEVPRGTGAGRAGARGRDAVDAGVRQGRDGSGGGADAMRGAADVGGVSDGGVHPSDAGGTDGSSRGEPPSVDPSAIASNLAEMAATVEATIADPAYYADGEWHHHFGDARMYGPAFDLASWALGGDASHFERAEAVLANDEQLARNAAANLLGSLGDVPNVAMALMGLLEAGRYAPDPAQHEAADALLDAIEPLAQSLGDYLELPDTGGYDNLYGPTAVSGFIPMAHLEHAAAYPDDDFDAHVQRAREALEHIRARAWDAELGAYRFAPDDPRLMLYPNAVMMLAWGRLYELAPDDDVRAHIEAIRTGIEPLRDPQGDHFHSPYSARYMGAQTDDYTTLSSQNYLMLGLWFGWQATGEAGYLADLAAILEWLNGHLLAGGLLVHHWIDGRPATPEDKVDLCIGCNLQTLYILELLAASP